MNRIYKSLIIILSFVLILIAAVLYFFYVNGQAGKDDSQPTADEIIENSVEIPEITTNLLSGEYVRISFMIETDGKKAKEELEKREFQVNNIIIKQLAGMEAKDLEGTDGKIKLEEQMEEKINELLNKGKVVQVYITSVVFQ